MRGAGGRLRGVASRRLRPAPPQGWGTGGARAGRVLGDPVGGPTSSVPGWTGAGQSGPRLRGCGRFLAWRSGARGRSRLFSYQDTPLFTALGHPENGPCFPCHPEISGDLERGPYPTSHDTVTSMSPNILRGTHLRPSQAAVPCSVTPQDGVL